MFIRKSHPSTKTVFFPRQNLIIMQIAHATKQYTKVNIRELLQLGVPVMVIDLLIDLSIDYAG